MTIRHTDRRRFIATAVAGLAGLSVALPVAATQEDPAAPPDPGTPTEDVLVQEQPAEFVPYGVPPVALAIPALGVEASVVGVAQDEDGAMGAPSNPDTVGWYTLGPGMGAGGNVIFAGHVNWGGVPRVFGYVETLRPGDAVLVVDAEGNGYQYVVETTLWVPAEGAPIEQIFDQTDGPLITLITCGGEYRAATREYVDRVVVRARGV